MKEKTKSFGIKTWPEDDRPREKLLKRSAGALSNSELLAILLRTGTNGISAIDLARKILKKFGTFRNMAHTDVREWEEFKGLGGAKIANIQAALEIGRRFRQDDVSAGKQKINERSLRFNQKSSEAYEAAENILLNEIGLLNWKPKQRSSFVKKYSDTQASGRIDAEYFQPQYEEIIKTVTKSNNHSTLSNIVSIKKCIEPGSEAYQDSGIPFLRVSNLSKFGINMDNQQFLSEKLYDSLEAHQPKKGEILLSKDATPGIAYCLTETPEKMIPSGGILRLTVRNVGQLYPEYLTLVLNSIIMQKQIERDAGGSIINHWLVDQVKNTLVPILPISKQKQITEKVNQSFFDRAQSKRLLEIAKQGVEMVIEKSEKDAINFIDAEIKKLKQPHTVPFNY